MSWCPRTAVGDRAVRPTASAASTVTPKPTTRSAFPAAVADAATAAAAAAAVIELEDQLD